MKATNRGTCQWCARVQMLPGGVLSKHGYSVLHGFFSGTCSGSGHLPYEQSKDLIDQSIASARRHIVAIDDQASELLATDPTTTNKVWMHIYKPELSSRKHGAVYVWEQHELLQDGGAEYRHYYILPRGQRVKAYEYMPLAMKVSKGIEGRVAALRAERQKLVDYIDSQERRIKDWKPQPLLPI